MQRVSETDAELRAGVRHGAGIAVAAEGGEQLHVHAQQPQIVRDVAPHAAEARVHMPGVGVLRPEPLGRLRADVDVHAARHRDIGHTITFFDIVFYNKIRLCARGAGVDKRISAW